MRNQWRERLGWRATLRYDERMPTKPATPTSHDPADPARVNPMHLPALAHCAADLDGLTAPVRITAPTALGSCAACPEYDLPDLGAIATVRATDSDGFVYVDPICPLHLHGEIRYHAHFGRSVVVEVPASGGRQWFERSDHETYYGLDEARGIAVVGGMWDTWTVVEARDRLGADRALATFPQRGDAECWAQAHAAHLAADAYETGHVLAELRPARVLDGVA